MEGAALRYMCILMPPAAYVAEAFRLPLKKNQVPWGFPRGSMEIRRWPHHSPLIPQNSTLTPHHFIWFRRFKLLAGKVFYKLIVKQLGRNNADDRHVFGFADSGIRS